MTDRSTCEAVPFSTDELARAGKMLGRAFQEDPLWVEILTDADRRPGQIEAMFIALIRTTLADRGFVETTPDLEGVAIWHPPGTDLGFRSMVKSGFALPRFVMSLPGEERRRMMGALGQIAERRKTMMPEPHWYLAAIGVDPEFHGRGFGSVLLESGMARATAHNLPVYLETETDANLDYYLHRGFELIDEFSLEGLEVHLFLMVWGRPTFSS